MLLELDQQRLRQSLLSQLRSTLLRQARRTSPNPRELTGLVGNQHLKRSCARERLPGDVDAVGLVTAAVHGNDGTTVRVQAGGCRRWNAHGNEGESDTVREVFQLPHGFVIGVLKINSTRRQSVSAESPGPPAAVR